jgi:hypothetical protein
MKTLGAAASAAILLGALALGSPASAFGGFWGAGWNGGGWQVNGWNGGWCLRPGDVGYGQLGSWNCEDYYAGPDFAFAPQVVPAAPVVTGRSVATGGIGDFCATPVKTCQLVQPSYVGGGCSCRVPGGRARGSVTP